MPKGPWAASLWALPWAALAGEKLYHRYQYYGPCYASNVCLPKHRVQFAGQTDPLLGLSCQALPYDENTGREICGRVLEEPEYEGISAFSSRRYPGYHYDGGVASEVDRLGMDINESGWVMAWLLECFEKRLLTPKIPMDWK